jgi:NAD(P)H-hydrate epimerase
MRAPPAFDIPLIPKDRPLPWITAEPMAEVDRAMVEDLGVKLIQMMEHAGRHLARLATLRFLRGRLSTARVLVLAGPGGNGGGALVAARRCPRGARR